MSLSQSARPLQGSPATVSPPSSLPPSSLPPSSPSSPPPSPRLRPLSKPSQSSRTHFLWIISISPLYQRTRKDVTREICLYLPIGIAKLVTLHFSSVTSWAADPPRWIEEFTFNNKGRRPELSAVVWGRDQWVFTCGGYGELRQELKSAYEITRESMRKLPSMSTPRTYLGIAYDPRFLSIYVFGGHSGTCNPQTAILGSAEKFNLSTEEWRPLRDMSKPRYCFQPCISGETIVLCGGDKTGSCELFDMNREEYRRLTIVTNPGTAFTVADGGLLITYSNNLIQRWSVASPDIISTNACFSLVWCPCPPVRINRSTCFYRYDTGSFRKIADDDS